MSVRSVQKRGKENDTKNQRKTKFFWIFSVQKKMATMTQKTSENQKWSIFEVATSNNQRFSGFLCQKNKERKK